MKKKSTKSKRIHAIIGGVLGGLLILLLLFLIQFIPAHRKTNIAVAESRISTLKNALENFFIDHRSYPLAAASERISDASSFADGEWHDLMTPVAFISGYPLDPFSGYFFPLTFRYYSDGSTWYVLASNGPDRDQDLYPPQVFSTMKNAPYKLQSAGYDPSNGVVSNGDLIYIGP